MLVFPRRKLTEFTGTVDDDYVMLACPDIQDSYVVTDSDEILACELSELSHSVVSSFQKRSISAAANWVYIHANRYHRWLVQHAIHLKSSHAYEDAALWQETQDKARHKIRRILAYLNQPSLIFVLKHPITALRKFIKFVYASLNKYQYYHDRSNQLSLLQWLKMTSLRLILKAHKLYLWLRIKYFPINNV